MFSLPHHSPRDLPFGRRQTAILFVDMQRAWVEPGATRTSIRRQPVTSTSACRTR